MSDLLGDLLSKRNYGEPPEIQQIKEFVQKEISVVPRVTITPDNYIVLLPSAAAAGALRGKLYRLQKELGGVKRLIIRIG